jgi:hypothetical protein
VDVGRRTNPNGIPKLFRRFGRRYDAAHEPHPNDRAELHGRPVKLSRRFDAVEAQMMRDGWKSPHILLGLSKIPPYQPNNRSTQQRGLNRPGLVGDSWPWKHKDGVHANRSHSGEADDASVFD